MVSVAFLPDHEAGSVIEGLGSVNTYLKLCRDREAQNSILSRLTSVSSVQGYSPTKNR